MPYHPVNFEGPGCSVVELLIWNCLQIAGPCEKEIVDGWSGGIDRLNVDVGTEELNMIKYAQVS